MNIRGEKLTKDLIELQFGDVLKVDGLFYIVAKDNDSAFLVSLNATESCIMYRVHMPNIDLLIDYLSKSLGDYEYDLYSKNDYDLKIVRRG